MQPLRGGLSSGKGEPMVFPHAAWENRVVVLCMGKGHAISHSKLCMCAKGCQSVRVAAQPVQHTETKLPSSFRFS